MNLGIVVLNYSNYKLTEECIENLKKVSSNHKIVIVDNNSPNESYDYLRNRYVNDINIDVIKSNKNGGYASGNNYGIKFLLKKYKDVNYICIINPDVIIDNDNIFKNLTTILEERENLALISCIKVDHNIVNYKWSSWKRPTNTQLILSPLLLSRKLGIDRSNEEIRVDKDGIAKVDVIPGCFFIIKVSVLEEMNFFDEGTFLYQEENIIAFKLSKLNKGYYSAIYVKDYYFHNHVNNKFTNKLKGRIKSTKVYNDSLEYLLKNYYNNNLLLLLKISIILSYIEIFIIHILSSIKQFIRK